MAWTVIAATTREATAAVSNTASFVWFWLNAHKTVSHTPSLNKSSGWWFIQSRSTVIAPDVTNSREVPSHEFCHFRAEWDCMHSHFGNENNGTLFYIWHSNVEAFITIKIRLCKMLHEEPSCLSNLTVSLVFTRERTWAATWHWTWITLEGNLWRSSLWSIARQPAPRLPPWHRINFDHCSCQNIHCNVWVLFIFPILDHDEQNCGRQRLNFLTSPVRFHILSMTAWVHPHPKDSSDTSDHCFWNGDHWLFEGLGGECFIGLLSAQTQNGCQGVSTRCIAIS